MRVPRVNVNILEAAASGTLGAALEYCLDGTSWTDTAISFTAAAGLYVGAKTVHAIFDRTPPALETTPSWRNRIANMLKPITTSMNAVETGGVALVSAMVLPSSSAVDTTINMMTGVGGYATAKTVCETFSSIGKATGLRR